MSDIFNFKKQPGEPQVSAYFRRQIGLDSWDMCHMEGTTNGLGEKVGRLGLWEAII
jgi:hypothetical protein